LIKREPFGGFFANRRAFFSLWLYRSIRIIIAGIFLWSGVTKFFNPKTFAVLIEAYGLIPESWIMPVAIGLPALEVIAAIGLLFDIRGSLTIITGLLALFMLILGYGIWLGLDIDCGCFGPEDPEANAYHGLRPALYRDLLLITGAIYLYLWRYRQSAKAVSFYYYFSKYIKRRS
jgi:uncharacterized membrane protein YphA (DoxX/SURF4 family)